MRRLLLAVAVGVAPLMSSGVAHAGPPPMDPRQMSGIPRADPQVQPGTITVRCLLGSFSEPAVGQEVTLEVRSADGSKSETRTASTQEEGRATFGELADFTGGQAVARTSFDGQVVSSRPIPLQPNMGSRVLLVKGAAAPTAAPGPAPGPHGGAGEIPPPGTPFPIEGHPAGTLIVGTLDLNDRGRAAGIEVKLVAMPPAGDPVEKTLTSDDSGRVIFRDLVPPTLPEGSKIVVEAQISTDGEPQRSEPFTLPTDGAVAVYLAEGFEKIEQQQAARAPAPAPRQRPPVPGPRTDPKLPPGTVAVKVVDGDDRPVAGQPVQIWKKDVTGNDETFDGKTGADGVAVVENVPVQEDAFYFVGVAYQGAPYQSSFFELTKRTGVRADVRVFPVTGDRSRVRSAVQFDVRARENDVAQVSQVYQVFIEGDEAFWPEEGRLRIGGPEGTKGLVVLRPASPWLEEKDGAPFAELSGPIPPGEVANLSVAYLLPHDGELDLSWAPPFPVVETSVILPDELALVSPGVTGTKPEHETQDPVTFYSLGERPIGAPVNFVVGELPVRPRVFRQVALALGLLAALGAWLAVWRRPRQTERDRLDARRRDLEALLREAQGAERERIAAALDDVFRRLDALAGSGATADNAAGT